MTKYFRSYIEVNLTNLAFNYNYLNSFSQKNTKTAAVVKADAYGIGAPAVSKHLRSLGCEDFFVSTLDEALEIDKAVKAANIYILTGVAKEEIDEVAHRAFIPVISNKQQLDVIVNHASPIDCCLKFDTGMNRLGFRQSEIATVRGIVGSNAMKLRYIISHLGNAEEKEDPRNIIQLKRFQEILTHFPKTKASFCNSAGILLGADYHYDLTRPGAYMYGICMTQGAHNNQKQVISKYTEVIHRYIADYKEEVSYGSTHNITPGQKILVVRVGYADCYMRSNGNRAYMYALGHKLPVVGNVTMDMTMLDASSLNDAEFAECNFVEVFGKHVTISEVASLNNTTAYEILTGVGKRFSKKYVI